VIQTSQTKLSLLNFSRKVYRRKIQLLKNNRTQMLLQDGRQNRDNSGTLL